MIRIIDKALYADSVLHHHYSLAPRAAQSEVLAGRKAAGRREHERAVAGDFNPDRPVYVDHLTFICDDHQSDPMDLLAYLVEPDRFMPVSLNP